MNQKEPLLSKPRPNPLGVYPLPTLEASEPLDVLSIRRWEDDGGVAEDEQTVIAARAELCPIHADPSVNSGGDSPNEEPRESQLLSDGMLLAYLEALPRQS